jgi:simple sugar transport system substrate-binding protein
MKKLSLKMVVVLMCISLISVFSLFGCEAEEAVEEVEEGAEEAVEEVEEGAEEAVEEVEEGAEEAVVAEEERYYAFVTHGGDDPFWATVKRGVEDAAEVIGCKITFSLDGGDLAAQRKSFDEAVASNPDGIALVINDESAWDKPVQDAIDSGIPVCGFDNDDPKGAAGNARIFYVGSDDYAGGIAIGQKLIIIAQDMGIDLASATAAMPAETIGATYVNQRSAGVNKAFEDFGMTTKLEIVDAGGLERTVVEERMTAYLLANPDVTFLLGAGSICTEMLGASLKGAGIDPGAVISGGFGTLTGTIEGIKEGYVHATVDQQPYLAGYLTLVSLHLNSLYGLAPQINTGGGIVTKDNIGVLEEFAGTYR